MRKYLFTPDTQATGRKVLALGLAAILALSACLMAACTPSAEEGLNQPASSSQATGEEDITLAPLTLVTADDPLLAFAANSTAAVLNGPDAGASAGAPDSLLEQNLCYSPLSLYLACSLVGLGTQGGSQEQLLTLLGAGDQAQLAALNEGVRLQLEDTFGDAQVQVADSIWAGKGYSFTDAFRQQAEALGAGAFDVTFGTPEADQQISNWISDQTEDLLKPTLSTEDGQAALLVNTIYFKDGWASPFTAEQTQTAPFHAPGQEVQADLMRQTVTDSLYGEGEGFTAAALSFTGGSTMTFYLPDEGTHLSSLLQDPQSVLDLMSLELEPQSVDWWIPKSQATSSLKRLVESLKALGVTDIFSPQSPEDFAPMIAADDGSGGFCVSSVLQDTHLALDEAGVEAAAYTAIGIEKMALMPDAEPVEFKLDRPFFYTLVSPDGNILFAGVLYNPGL